MASNAAPSSASVPICDLKRGDVVVFESAWSLNGAVIAVVIDRTGQGPRLIAPGQSEPQLARAGTVRDVLDVDELLGLDARGDYHLVADDDDVAGDRIIWRTPAGVVGQADLVARGFGVADWIRHVETEVGWQSLASRHQEILDAVCRGAGGETA